MSSLRRMPVEYKVSSIARSRRPIGIIDIGLTDHLLDLTQGQHVLRQSMLQARQLQLRGRVVEQMVLPREPAEEATDGDQARMLGAEGERLSVGLAPVIERALVALQDGLGDLLRRGQAPLGAPDDEVPQVHLAVLDRGGGVVVHAQPLQIPHGEGGQPLGVAPVGERPLGERVQRLPGSHDFRRKQRLRRKS